MSETAVFTKGNPMRHVAVMSFTASVGILAIFAVDFVDMIFISMLGHDALAAAVGYAGTMLFFTNSINIGLSIAAGSLVSRALGAGQVQQAREHATSVTLFAFCMGIIIPLLLMSNLEQLMHLLGARDETLAFAVRYCTIVLPTMSFMGLAMTAMAVLRAYGNARSSMTVTLSGGFINAILDPLLIFGLSLGLDGAAYASVIARCCMMIYGYWAAISQHNGFCALSLGLVRRDFVVVLAITLPAVLTNLATPMGNAVVTREIAHYGSEAVAAMAVIGRLTPMAFAVVLALSGAIGPIVGQNFGAGLFCRVKSTFLAGLKFVAIYVCIATVLLFFMREFIVDIFDASAEMQVLIYLFCGYLALLQFFNGAIFVCNASFNNLGQPLYSTVVNWGRHTLGTWPFVIVGSSIAGASGVLIGQALGGVIFSVIGLVLAWRLIDRLEPVKKVDDFAQEEELHQVTCRRDW